MDTNQPASQPTYTPAPAAPGVFGTKIPSSVAFTLGILLFFLPFSEMKCGGSAFANKTGIAFAMGSEWKGSGGYGKETIGELAAKTTGKKAGNAQYFAIAALALGVLGLLLSLFGSGKAGYGGVIAGLFATGSLVALMLEVNTWFKGALAKEASEKAKEGADSIGLDKLGDSTTYTLTFTPWFYIAGAAFLAAAFFCYKRMSSAKN